MEELHLIDLPRKSGPYRTVGPLPLTIRQCYTHRKGTKCVQSQVCPCRAANHPCTSSFPSESFCNRVPTRNPPPGGRPRSPTSFSLTSNANQNIQEANKAAPIICQDKTPVLFYPEVIEFSTNVLTEG